MPFAFSDSVLKSRQHALCPDRGFGPFPAGAYLSVQFSPGLVIRHEHSWRLYFQRFGQGASIFLRPLAPPALPGFKATMDALTPEPPAIRSCCPPDPVEGMYGSYHRLEGPLKVCGSGLPASRDRSSEHSVPNHLTVPAVALTHSPSARQAFRASPRERGLADRPCRNGFVILRTALSRPVAFHPSSRRRSYFLLQAGVCMPEEDLHLSGRSRAQAHSSRRKQGSRVFTQAFLTGLLRSQE